MFKRRYIVVAEESELSLPAAKEQIEKGRIPIVTGVGFSNVIRSLRNLPKRADIFNVGYCGGYKIAKGQVVRIGCCRTFHKMNFSEALYVLNGGGCVECLTAGDFVESTEGLPVFPCVVDMELAAICAMGFKRVQSVKYVSDNLNFEQYKKTINE